MKEGEIVLVYKGSRGRVSFNFAEIDNSGKLTFRPIDETLDVG